MTEAFIRVARERRPGSEDNVSEMSIQVKHLIDQMLSIQSSPVADRHERRWAAEAAACFETGQMYAAKALSHHPCSDQD